jgi:hypothetical protein
MNVETTIVTDDDETVTITKMPVSRHVWIKVRDADGRRVTAVHLTDDDALQLAYALLPDGYSINDPDA